MYCGASGHEMLVITTFFFLLSLTSGSWPIRECRPTWSVLTGRTMDPREGGVEHYVANVQECKQFCDSDTTCVMFYYEPDAMGLCLTTSDPRQTVSTTLSFGVVYIRQPCHNGPDSCYDASSPFGAYIGSQNVTVSGMPCLYWNDTDYTIANGFTYPDGDEVDAKNYCRMPDSSIVGGPWCVTSISEGNLEKEECGIPPASDFTTIFISHPGLSTSGGVSVSTANDNNSCKQHCLENYQCVMYQFDSMLMKCEIFTENGYYIAIEDPVSDLYEIDRCPPASSTTTNPETEDPETTTNPETEDPETTDGEITDNDLQEITTIPVSTDETTQ